jgi:hypothetical protein
MVDRANEKIRVDQLKVPNPLRPYTPLNQAEINFLGVYNLKVTRFHNWVVHVTDANGRKLMLDREKSFIDWAIQVKSHDQT